LQMYPIRNNNYSWWPCFSVRSRCAVFRIYSALTSHGSSKIYNAVRRQRNLGLVCVGSVLSFLKAPLQHDFALDPMIPPFVFHFSNICHVTKRKPRLPQCIMGDDLHIKNVLTQSWRSKSAVFRIYSAVTSHGSSKIYNAV
jgi:hypothetical protein